MNSEANLNWFEWANAHLEESKTREAKTFTPRALRAIRFAVQEARRLKRNAIGTEHLLLGLVGLDKGVVVEVLKHCGLNPETVRLAVENLVGFGSEENLPARIAYTPRSKHVLETAKRHAKKFGHTYIGTEHLLLGLLEETDGPASRIFKEFKVNMEQLRVGILTELTPVNSPKNEHRRAKDGVFYKFYA
jgi:ATP-dependent Clp protease ATP-binding subunit ClpC